MCLSVLKCSLVSGNQTAPLVRTHVCFAVLVTCVYWQGAWSWQMSQRCRHVRFPSRRRTSAQTGHVFKQPGLFRLYTCRAEAHAAGGGAAVLQRQADAMHCGATEDPSMETEGSPVPAGTLGAGAPAPGGLQRQFSDSASSLRAQAALGAVRQGKRGSGLGSASGAGSAIAVPGGAAGRRPSGAPASLPDMRLGLGLGEAGALGSVVDPESGSWRSAGGLTQPASAEEAASAQHPCALVTKRSLSFDSQRGRRGGGHADGGPPGRVPEGIPGFHWAAPPKPGADEVRHAAEPLASPGTLEDSLARLTSAQVCSTACFGCECLRATVMLKCHCVSRQEAVGATTHLLCSSQSKLRCRSRCHYQPPAAEERSRPACMYEHASSSCRAMCWCGVQLRERQARAWRVSAPLLVGVGATAAVCSGCLSALSGIGGPPIILMYELLRVPQARFQCETCICASHLSALGCQGHGLGVVCGHAVTRSQDWML